MRLASKEIEKAYFNKIYITGTNESYIHYNCKRLIGESIISVRCLSVHCSETILKLRALPKG